MKSLESVLDIFVKRLTELMTKREKKMSIAELGNEAGIPRTTINNWLLKKRSPTLYSAYIIAKYFNVSIDYLVGLKDFE